MPKLTQFTGETMAEIAERYEGGESLEQLHRAFGNSTSAILRLLKDLGVPIRPRGSKGGQKNIPILTPERQQELRDRAGRESQSQIARSMGIGNATVHRWLRQLGLSSGSKKGSDHYAWNGGRKHNHGYVLIKLHKSDPFYSMATRTGIVREHRIVMARHLGRPLDPTETVHHKNGDRQDNRIDNLQVMVSAHPRGAIMVCACCGSRDFIYLDLE